jgi:hypothetical protein
MNKYYAEIYDRVESMPLTERDKKAYEDYKRMVKKTKRELRIIGYVVGVLVCLLSAAVLYAIYLVL